MIRRMQYRFWNGESLTLGKRYTELIKTGMKIEIYLRIESFFLYFT